MLCGKDSVYLQKVSAQASQCMQLVQADPRWNFFKSLIFCMSKNQSVLRSNQLFDKMDFK